MISAEMVLDSISPGNVRIMTMKLRYPRFVHAELMTHRVFTRNASSSRAVPSKKLIEECLSSELMAKPVAWGSNQRGMQAGDDLPPEKQQQIEELWEAAADFAGNTAAAMEKLGAHKQIVNRILEPFTHINVLVTSTEWDNFFALRLHRDADPTMRALALAMYPVARNSIPGRLKVDQWHLPFIDQEDRINIPNTFDQIRISVARCARVSYQSFMTQKRSTPDEDRELFHKLVVSRPTHASPAEHQAKPMKADDPYEGGLGGNLRGWVQYRQMISLGHEPWMNEGFPSVEYVFGSPSCDPVTGELLPLPLLD